MVDFVAIDFETANKKLDSACAIGLASVVDGQIVHSEKHLIRPHELRFEWQNTQIHGIRSRDVVDAPTLKELWPSIWEVCQGRLIVAHQTSTDINVLRDSLLANQIPHPQFDYLCTLQLARLILRHLDKHGLDYLAAQFGIPLVHHCPQSDAEATARVLLKALQEHSHSCPRELAKSFGASVCAYSEVKTPASSSSSTKKSSDGNARFKVPEGFDITSHPLYGKAIVITGNLGFCKQPDAEALIEKLGGQIKTTVGKKIDIVVSGPVDLSSLRNGETESSKLKTAKQRIAEGCPITILTPEEFRVYIREFEA
ncbi:exonuclease domain-containing protein [Aeoliella sp. SH292]|uniref:exonuclease domain-containing protein n=1 Tax=Aeoliella sp. SH292 TaxID=3454464 RepID=UPI003F9EB7F8